MSRVSRAEGHGGGTCLHGRNSRRPPARDRAATDSWEQSGGKRGRLEGWRQRHACAHAHRTHPHIPAHGAQTQAHARPHTLRCGQWTYVPHTLTCMHKHTCTHMHKYAPMCMCSDTCTHTLIYTHPHTHTLIFSCTHTCSHTDTMHAPTPHTRACAHACTCTRTLKMHTVTYTDQPRPPHSHSHPGTCRRCAHTKVQPCSHTHSGLPWNHSYIRTPSSHFQNISSFDKIQLFLLAHELAHLHPPPPPHSITRLK